MGASELGRLGRIEWFTAWLGNLNSVPCTGIGTVIPIGQGAGVRNGGTSSEHVEGRLEHAPVKRARIFSWGENSPREAITQSHKLFAHASDEKPRLLSCPGRRSRLCPRTGNGVSISGASSPWLRPAAPEPGAVWPPQWLLLSDTRPRQFGTSCAGASGEFEYDDGGGGEITGDSADSDDLGKEF